MMVLHQDISSSTTREAANLLVQIADELLILLIQRNPAPVEVGSLSHFLQGLYIPGIPNNFSQGELLKKKPNPFGEHLE